MKKTLLMISCILVTLQAGNLSDGMEALERGDLKAAFKFFKKAADGGNKMAQQNLAVMYNNGYGVKKNQELASIWFNRATSKEKLVIAQQ